MDQRFSAEMSPAQGRGSTRIAIQESRVLAALRAARSHLLGQQQADGHWCGELEGDTILESEYVLAMHFLGLGNDPRVAKAASYLRRQQLDQGGWAVYPGGDPDVSASVKAYFVLKLLGDPPTAPHMARARKVILRLGGVEACNSFTKIYLAIFRQYSWSRCPAVPPEMMLLPSWSYFNIYEMSSWSRAIVVPLSVIWAHRPRCAVPDSANIPELFAPRTPKNGTVSSNGRPRFWTYFFHGLDRSLKLVDRIPFKPLRATAVKKAEGWILKRLERSDGLGAIFPPLINTLFALRCLGHSLDHPVVQSQLRALRKLEIEEEDTLRIQPCLSSVWDTALALNALLESGLGGEHPDLARAGHWLLDREVKHPGDWQRRVKGVPPSGWFFEYANEPYPDCDDTAAVLSCLGRLTFAEPALEERRHRALGRGLNWLLAMQNKDGGWGAFDKGCDKKILTYIPFADHNAMIDPSWEDITGRSLETLAVLGFAEDHPAVRRAVKFLLRRQQHDGTWFGRWGCNHIYGTWLSVTGLSRFQDERTRARCQRSLEWILEHQNRDGGWGESPRSYEDSSTRGQGLSTAAQTAWAVLTLVAAGQHDCAAARRGLRYLLDTQREDGTWSDDSWTGTGFPRVFYLRYHLYAAYFPLLALARILKAMGVDGQQLAGPAAGRGPRSGPEEPAPE